MSKKHSQMIDNNHVPHSQVFNNDSERLAKNNLTEMDLFKQCYQKDIDEYFILKNQNPIEQKLFKSGSTIPIVPNDTVNITSSNSIQLTLESELIQNINMIQENLMVELPDNVLNEALGLRYIISNVGYYTFKLQSSNDAIQNIKPNTFYKVYLMDNTSIEGVQQLSEYNLNELYSFSQGISTLIEISPSAIEPKIVKLADDLFGVAYRLGLNGQIKILKITGSNILLLPNSNSHALIEGNIALSMIDANTILYNLRGVATYGGLCNIDYNDTIGILGTQYNVVNDTVGYTTDQDMIKLSETRVLLFRTSQGAAPNGQNLALINTINNKTLNILAGNNASAIQVNAIRLSSTRVVISYNELGTTRVVVIDIVNDVLIITDTFILPTAFNTIPEMTSITDSKFIIVGKRSSDSIPIIHLFTLDQSNKLVLSNTNTNQMNGHNFSECKISANSLNKVVIIINNTTLNKGCYIVINIDNINITPELPVEFHPESVSNINITKMTDSKMALIYKDSNYSNALMSCILYC